MDTSNEVIRVLVADDHPLARAGIRAVLERSPGVRVVAEAGNAAEAQRLAAELHPEVLLLDLHMPGPRPVDVVAWVREHCPATVILILTAYDCDAHLACMIAEETAGFICKNEVFESLVESVRRAARGEVLFSRQQLIRARRWREEVGERWKCLTERERQVLRLLMDGLDNAAIAKVLCVGTKTAAYHVTSILRKLGVASRLEAVVWVHTNIPSELVEFPGQV